MYYLLCAIHQVVFDIHNGGIVFFNISFLFVCKRQILILKYKNVLHFHSYLFSYGDVIVN